MAAALDVLATRTLRSYAALLRTRFGTRLERTVLFGSRARGDAREDSDIDVLVVIRDMTPSERREAVDLAYRASRETAPEAPILTPMVWSDHEHAARLRQERRLALDIEREGVPL